MGRFEMETTRTRLLHNKIKITCRDSLAQSREVAYESRETRLRVCVRVNRSSTPSIVPRTLFRITSTSCYTRKVLPFNCLRCLRHYANDKNSLIAHPHTFSGDISGTTRVWVESRVNCIIYSWSRALTTSNLHSSTRGEVRIEILEIHCSFILILILIQKVLVSQWEWRKPGWWIARRYVPAKTT